MSKRILVTGSDGYIGSHLVKHLVAHGYIVDGLDNRSYGEYNDITQYCSTHNVCDAMDIRGNWDVIVHLAGLVSVAEGQRKYVEYFQNNVWNSECLLKNTYTPHFIFASTSAAFDPQSNYARNKVAVEKLIKKHGVQHTIFRFFNVSGSGGYRQLGDATHLIRVIAEVITGKRQQLEIYGTDYNTPDGTAIRDYIHVLDIVSAIIRAIELGPQNTDYECLGTTTGSSVLDVLKTFENVAGKSIPHTLLDRRPGDLEKCTVDKLSTLIQPQYTLADMCYSQLKLERNKQ
jgi:UDP-glucose 4-epimerase